LSAGGTLWTFVEEIEELLRSHHPLSKPAIASSIRFIGTLTHNTMSTAEKIAIISILVNFILVYVIYRGNGRRSEYDFIDNQIADILKLQMQHPKYRQEGYEPDDPEEILRFDAYRCLVWNSLETMYEKYGERRLKRSSFFPAMQLLARRHKGWMDKHEAKEYNLKLRRFLTE